MILIENQDKTYEIEFPLSTMGFYNLFATSARWWFFSLIFVNLISLFFMNTLTQGTTGYGFTYASMVLNIIVTYLILAFMFLNYHAIEAEGDGNTTKPFHEWIWFGSSYLEKWVVGLSFFTWMIPNFVHLFYMNGLGYFLGVFFILSAIYWFVVMGAMFRSSRNH